MIAVTSCLNFASAQNETEMMLADSEEEIESRIDEEVKSSENGHVNIRFDDDYNGYCINYGSHEAAAGDTFTVKNTSYAVNRYSGEDVGNCLKVYFVDYYENAMKDDIVTQHTIWHFTDDFNGWRLDYDLIENIKNTALTKTIPDHGAVRQINNTTEAVFDFEVLSSGRSDYQNFFGYKITYRDITNDDKSNLENTSLDNSSANNLSNENLTVQESNSTNESGESKSDNLTYENESDQMTNASGNGLAKLNQTEDKKNSTGKDNHEESMRLSKHTTGKRSIGILLLLILLTVMAIKFIYRD